MIDPPAAGHPAPRVLAIIFTIVALVAACGAGGEASGAPPPAPGAPGASGTEPSTSGDPSSDPEAPTDVPPEAPSAAPGAPGGFLDPATPTACLDLGDQDCARARDLAATVLQGGDPPARYVQVGPFACAAGERCPTTLAARPEGDVVIEFDGGEGINVHLKVAPDGSFDAERQPAMGVAVAPSSGPGLAAGPMQYTLGHCGVFSGIDVDGAWWDPVGPVDMASGDAVNASTGVMTVSDPNHATFTTPTGFALQLQRRAGPKLLPFCM